MNCAKVISTTDELPGKLDLSIYQSATYTKVITYYASWNDCNQTGTPVDLTGWSAAMTVAAGQTTILSLSTAAGGITLGGTAGTVTLSVSAATTAALTAPQNAEYDLLLTDTAGNVTALLTGAVAVRRSITGG